MTEPSTTNREQENDRSNYENNSITFLRIRVEQKRHTKFYENRSW